MKSAIATKKYTLTDANAIPTVENQVLADAAIQYVEITPGAELAQNAVVVLFKTNRTIQSIISAENITTNTGAVVAGPLFTITEDGKGIQVRNPAEAAIPVTTHFRILFLLTY